MGRSRFFDFFVQILIGVPLAIIAFQIGVLLVMKWGWYPPVAALPLYPLFALFLGLGLHQAFLWFGYGLYLNRERFVHYFINHLIAFASANIGYCILLYIWPESDFRKLAFPCMAATLVISGVLNRRKLRT